jgi:hypothetical protein
MVCGWHFTLQGLAFEKGASVIRIVLPYHLRNLAGVQGEAQVQVDATRPLTLGGALDALEAQYPMLRGTIRDHGTFQRRPFVRYFVCERDVSLEPPDAPLPEEVISGKEPFMVVGAIAGG